MLKKASEKTIILNVNGMSCGHCESSIKKALGELKGIQNVSVDLAAKTVSIDLNEDFISAQEIKNVIEDQGFDVD